MKSDDDGNDINKNYGNNTDTNNDIIIISDCFYRHYCN